MNRKILRRVFYYLKFRILAGNRRKLTNMSDDSQDDFSPNSDTNTTTNAEPQHSTLKRVLYSHLREPEREVDKNFLYPKLENGCYRIYPGTFAQMAPKKWGGNVEEIEEISSQEEGCVNTDLIDDGGDGDCGMDAACGANLRIEFENDDSERIRGENLDGEITTGKDGLKMLKLQAKKAYLPYIIGRQQKTIKGIEKETGVLINAPGKGEDGFITITANTKEKVVAAHGKITSVMNDFRQKHQFTHFISIPVTSQIVKEKYKYFRDRVLEMFKGENVAAIAEDIFQNANKLHLTLTMLVLLDAEEEEHLANILNQCRDDIIEPFLRGKGKLRVKFKGLKCMNGDGSKAKVLYANIVEGAELILLQNLADKIVDYCCEKSDLVKKEYDKVTLHLTVMNTTYLLSRNRNKRDNNRDKKKEKITRHFDATQILRAFEDYDFGAIDVDTIHISKRFTSGDDEYYVPVPSGIIKF